MVTRFIATPHRRAGLLSIPPTAVFVVKRLAKDGELILLVNLRDLIKGALPRVPELSVMIHGWNRRTEGREARRKKSRTRSRITVEI
jgi:hypothetical protein